MTPLLLNLFFIVAGLKQPDEFMVNLAAMATGDFLGCLLVVALLRLAIAAVRALRIPV